jgi:hypothetical protein
VEPASQDFGRRISQFVTRVGGMKRLSPSFTAAAFALAKNAHEKYEAFLEKDIREKHLGPDGSVERYTVPPPQYGKHRRLMRALDDSHVFVDYLPKMAVVALVSIYDSYLGSLVRALYAAKPEALNASNRQLTYAQLTDFGSIEEARECIVEKEVESLLRQSHIEQFNWLEERVGIPLRKNLAAWPEFVELTERRNLFVHSDGVVGRQYLAVCSQENVKAESLSKAGEQVHAPRKYFLRSCDVVMEIGVKLGQVLWRKTLQGGLKDADSQLNEVCYELLLLGDYSQAVVLGEFACLPPPIGLPRHGSEELKLTFLVNLAQAYKWGGREDDCRRLVRGIDWTALSAKFRLAAAVLEDDFAGAAALVREIGQSTELRPSAYTDWPLFREFRKTQAFLDAYEAAFGEPFKVVSHRHVDPISSDAGPASEPSRTASTGGEESAG